MGRRLDHIAHVFRDGDAWCVTGPELLDLARSPADFGDTLEEAIGALRSELRNACNLDHALPKLVAFTVQGE